MPTSPTSKPSQPEWFATPDAERGRAEAGLRFSCTMCGNCCSGPEGYVLVTDAEAAALATRLGVGVDEFWKKYTHKTSEGQSLKEKKSEGGLDCIFLDREKIPGKAVCGVYEDRPAQCRTWPFWPSVIRSRVTWDHAKRLCPGMDKGKLYTPVQIRIARDSFDI